MRRTSRLLGPLVVAAMAACGGAGGAADASLTCLDCDGAPTTDAGAFTWRLEARAATRIYRYQDASPISAGRSTRIAVEHPLAVCDRWAMPRVEIAAATHEVIVTPQVFVRQPPCTGAASATRVITLELTAASWTIRAADATAPPLTLVVGPAPTRPCGTAGACAIDCDCDRAAGERCVGAMTAAGATTTCARPCERDRDCLGGACVDPDVGARHACAAGPECAASTPCSAGYQCGADGACAPTFVLGQATRRPCADDRACAAGLRCVEATAGAGAPRCEVACPTGGGWCHGAHVCGPAADDLGGLARSDSVCGFLGD